MPKTSESDLTQNLKHGAAVAAARGLHALAATLAQRAVELEMAQARVNCLGL